MSSRLTLVAALFLAASPAFAAERVSDAVAGINPSAIRTRVCVPDSHQRSFASDFVFAAGIRLDELRGFIAGRRGNENGGRICR